VLKYAKRDVVLEGTWATRAWEQAANPVAYGKDGTLAVYNHAELRKHTGGDPETVEVPPMATKNPVVYLLECLREGRQPEGILNADIAADACRILDAAIASSIDGCAKAP
jgi:hypothetical protein